MHERRRYNIFFILHNAETRDEFTNIFRTRITLDFSCHIVSLLFL